MSFLTTIEYTAQLIAADKANKSPLGLISNPSPLLNIMQPTPAKAMTEPKITPNFIRSLKTIPIRMVVKIGEIDANKETLLVVVNFRA